MNHHKAELHWRQCWCLYAPHWHHQHKMAASAHWGFLASVLHNERKHHPPVICPWLCPIKTATVILMPSKWIKGGMFFTLCGRNKTSGLCPVELLTLCVVLTLHKPFLPFTFWLSQESVASLFQKPPCVSVIGGPALSDCISDPAGSQYGLNTLERWDRIGRVEWGRS